MDPDPSINKIKDLFISKGTLLQVKRGPRYLHALDVVLKNLEKRLSQYLLKYPHSDLRRCLQSAVLGYNQKIHSAHKLTPEVANDSILDGILRQRM